MHVNQSIVINRSRPHVYAYWRALGQLPHFMQHLISVSGDTNGVTHWTAKAPVGTVEWDAQITEDRPNELIAWQSLDGADVPNAGTVQFSDEPGDATLVDVTLTYDPPAGAVGALVAKLFGEAPDQQIADDLHRLKQILETGEIIGETDTPDSDDLTGNTLATGGVGVENIGYSAAGPAGSGTGVGGIIVTRTPDASRSGKIDPHKT